MLLGPGKQGFHQGPHCWECISKKMSKYPCSGTWWWRSTMEGNAIWVENQNTPRPMFSLVSIFPLKVLSDSSLSLPHSFIICQKTQGAPGRIFFGVFLVPLAGSYSMWSQETVLLRIRLRLIWVSLTYVWHRKRSGHQVTPEACVYFVH